MMNIKRAILGSVVAATALIASAGPVAAGGYDHNGWVPPSRLEGTWVVSINPYDCTTGNATPVFIKAFHTFTGGGTMVESTAGITFQPGQRGPGLGFWERTGRYSFRSVFEAFVLFDSVDRRLARRPTSEAPSVSTRALSFRTPITGSATPR